MNETDLESRLLYRDALMLVLNKPAGIPVHAGPKGGINLEQFFDQLCFGLPRLPSLAHRLDKDTSGCLVLGRHKKALQMLAKLFASGHIKKTYWAVVVGGPVEDEGIIDAPMGRRSHDKRSWWMKIDLDGQPALTHFKVLGRGGGVCWLELRPHTGRTHQLRVHTAHLGCPIVGDGLYGGDRARGVDARLHLHARTIEIPLYKNKPPVCIQAPGAAHMHALMRACGAQDANFT